MVKFTATLLKFDDQGEKTGWTYIEIPQEVAEQLKPNNKKSFRVKGKLDNYPVKSIALMPMGKGNFIMAVNAGMRKGIGKRKGAMISVAIALDDNELELNVDFVECMKDEPAALKYFNDLAKGHQRYFNSWINGAKTAQTKDKRIVMAVSALSRNLGYAEMLREKKL